MTFVGNVKGELSLESLLLPTLSEVMATDSVSKIKMIQLGLTPFYDVIAKQAENFKLVMPKDAEVARCFVQYAQSAMSMAEISNELQAFLQNGRLNPNVPDGSRMVKSTQLIGTFFQSLKKLEDVASHVVAEEKPCLEELLPHWKACGSTFAQELVSPLEERFFSNVFTHKFLQAILCVLMCCLYLQW